MEMGREALWECVHPPTWQVAGEGLTSCLPFPSPKYPELARVYINNSHFSKWGPTIVFRCVPVNTPWEKAGWSTHSFLNAQLWRPNCCVPHNLEEKKYQGDKRGYRTHSVSVISTRKHLLTSIQCIFIYNVRVYVVQWYSFCQACRRPRVRFQHHRYNDKNKTHVITF